MIKEFGFYRVIIKLADDYYSASLSIEYSDREPGEVADFNNVLAFI